MKNYIISKEQYLSALSTWKQFATHSASDHIIYNLIRSFDPKRGFTPIQNPAKLGSGSTPWQSFLTALSSADRQLAEPRIPSRLSEDQISSNIAAHYAKLATRYGVQFDAALCKTFREQIAAAITLLKSEAAK